MIKWNTSEFGPLFFDLNKISSIKNDVECPGDDFLWFSGIFFRLIISTTIMYDDTSRLLKTRRANCSRFTTPNPVNAQALCAIWSPPKRPSLRCVSLAALIRASPFALAWWWPCWNPSSRRFQRENRAISVISLNKLGLSAIRTVNGWLGLREEDVQKDSSRYEILCTN